MAYFYWAPGDKPRLFANSRELHYGPPKSEEEATEFFKNSKNVIFPFEEKVDLTQLCCMVIDGKVRNVEFLLKTGKLDINEKMENGRTALFVACEFLLPNMVALLLHHGANVNERDTKGLTPLHIACAHRHTTIVKKLIDKGADVHAACAMGTPIVTASFWPLPLMASDVKDPFDVLSILIEHGANVNDKSELTGLNALDYAINENNIKVVNLLIASKANVNESICQTPRFFIAVDKELVEVIKTFIKVEHLDLNMRDLKQNTALHKACWLGSLTIVKLLVERGFDVNAQNVELYTPLHLALMRKHYHVAEYLLESELINVNIPAEHKNYPVHTAICFADRTASGSRLKLKLKVIKTIIDRTDDLNEGKGEAGTPLIVAAKGNEVELAKYLIMKGAQVNAFVVIGLSQLSALHFACEPQTNVELVKLLLSHGAKVNNTSNVGMNQPLGIAIKTGDCEKIRELLKYGAQIDKAYVDQNLACKSRCSSGAEIIERIKINDLLTLSLEFLKNVRLNRYEDVKKNIEAGAIVNVSSERCGSALIYASWKGFEEIVDLLLDNGADVNFKSHTGYTSLHMACRFHSDEIIARKLLRHGAYYNLRDDKKHKTPRKHSREGKANHLYVLLRLVDMNFEDVKQKNPEIIPRLLLLKQNDKAEFDFLKIVKNTRGENLVSLAIPGESDCEFLRDLKNVFQEDLE